MNSVNPIHGGASQIPRKNTTGATEDVGTPGDIGEPPGGNDGIKASGRLRFLVTDLRL